MPWDNRVDFMGEIGYIFAIGTLLRLRLVHLSEVRLSRKSREKA